MGNSGDHEDGTRGGSFRPRDVGGTDAVDDPKRKKTFHRQSDQLFLPGSIVKVEVKNFMTYLECTMEPGPTLNLVLGPNGTGKSSFVCALCVGLAGSTKLLGRADDVGSYVRRGKDQGEVKVTMAKEGGGRTTVRRHIKKEGAKSSSQFYIDGVHVPMKRVQELVKRYNIQLDNLCQFLPQDKVAEFARMKPTELLQATELAIGDGELHQLHTSLIADHKLLDEKQKVLEMHENAVHRHKKELKELEKLLAPIRQKQRLKSEMDVLEAYRLWKLYEDAVNISEVEEETLEKAKNTLARLKKEQLNIQNGPVKKKNEARARAEKSAKAASKEVNSHNIEVLATSIDNDINRAIKSSDKISTLQERAKKHQSKIAAAEHDIRNFEEQIKAMTEGPSDEEKIKREIKMIDQQLKDLHAEELNFSRARHEMDDELMRLKRAEKSFFDRLRRLGERQNQALMALERFAPGTARAYQHVKAIRSRFRGQVLGPLALEVEVHKGHYARVLESHIPKNWLYYYFVEYQEDMEALKKELINQGVTPRIVLFEGDIKAPLKRMNGRSSSLASFGVAASLDETFDCHPIIKQALDNHFNISSTFVMDEKGKNDWEALLRAHPRIETVYTANQQIRNRQSWYDKNARAQMTTTIRPSQFLHMNSSSSESTQEEMGKLKHDLSLNKAAVEDVERRMEDLKPDLDRIQSHKKALSAERQKLNMKINHADIQLINARKKLRALSVQLENLKKMKDPLSERAALVQDAQIGLKAALKTTSKLLSSTASFHKFLFKEMSNSLSAKELTEQIKELMEASDKKKQEREELEESVQALEAFVSDARQKKERLKTEASNVSGYPIPDTLQKKFDVLSLSLSTVADIDDTYASTKAEHDTIMDRRSKCRESI
jgi:chromosome segregation ATPase